METKYAIFETFSNGFIGIETGLEYNEAIRLFNELFVNAARPKIELVKYTGENGYANETEIEATKSFL